MKIIETKRFIQWLFILAISALSIAAVVRVGQHINSTKNQSNDSTTSK
tara:strand:+ start:294 stop:437 length:144 start_codon:yes stop_codon:yes gene_type:complete